MVYSKKRKSIKKINKKKRINKTRKYRIKGGNNSNGVECAMCGKIVSKKDTLVPSICSLQHGQRAHRICQNCWWDPNTGFALENGSHQCPGCVKGLPLLPKEKAITIDLTDD